MKKYILMALLLTTVFVKGSFAKDEKYEYKEVPEKVIENVHDEHNEEKHGEGEHEESHEEKHDEENHEEDHDEEESDEHEEAGGEVDLTPESMKEAGIVVEPLTLQNLSVEIKAPGEIKLNSYLSSKITPRIEAQVITRHAKLGDEVIKGTPLITLSSVDMAEAVGDLLVAHKEWRRVKKLGTSVVSAKRYSEAKIADEQALAKVTAYGMTKAQVKTLHAKGIKNNPGIFQLSATHNGTIIRDNFIEGELIEPGRVLFDTVNETSLWVESQLSPEQAKAVQKGADARIQTPGNGWVQGKVIQKHHLLDKETRTIGVRIEVDNKEDLLHPGMYVDTRIQGGEKGEYLAVPTASVLRSPDGDWVVFVEQEKAGEFKPVEIEALRTVEDYTVIEGLPEGTRIVTKGAFFVQSELAKGGFSVHNH